MKPVVVYILYSKLSGKLESKTFDRFFNQFPSFIQNKILRFRKWQDAQRCLIGNILLMKGLKFVNKANLTLDDLKFTEYKRPYFDDSFDFNISHSGDYVMCAISKTNKVGVDVEEIQNIEINEFENEFSLKEREQIMQSDKSLHAFFTLWTQKEAFLKAIGTGLHVSLNKISIKENKIVWSGKQWLLCEIKLNGGYISHIAIDVCHPVIKIEEVKLT